MNNIASFSKILLAFGITILISACMTNNKTTEDAPIVYLNTSLGYAGENATYSQNEFVCDVDKKLVEGVISKAASHNIKIIPITSFSQVTPQDKLLAIDFTKLAGSSSTDHVGSSTSTPEIGIEAALLTDGKEISGLRFEDLCTADLDYSGSGSGGTGSGFGVVKSRTCSGLNRCALRLSNNLAKWLDKELKTNTP